MSAPLISPRHPCSSSFLSAIILPLLGSCLKFGRAASVCSVLPIAPNRVSGLFHPHAWCPALHEAGSSPGRSPAATQSLAWAKKLPPPPASRPAINQSERSLSERCLLVHGESSFDSVTANFCNCSIEAKIVWCTSAGNFMLLFLVEVDRLISWPINHTNFWYFDSNGQYQWSRGQWKEINK